MGPAVAASTVAVCAIAYGCSATGSHKSAAPRTPRVEPEQPTAPLPPSIFSDRAHVPELHRLQRALRVTESAAHSLSVLVQKKEQSAEPPREPWVIDQLHREAEERRLAAQREQERLRLLREQDARRASERRDRLARQDARRARQEAERLRKDAARKRVQAELGRQRLAREAEAARPHTNVAPVRAAPHATSVALATPTTQPEEAAELKPVAAATTRSETPPATGRVPSNARSAPPGRVAVAAASQPTKDVKREPIQIAETTIVVAPPQRAAPEPKAEPQRAAPEPKAAPKPKAAPEPKAAPKPKAAPPVAEPAAEPKAAPPAAPRAPRPKPAKNVDRPRRPTPMSAEEATKTLALAFERATGAEATKEVVSVLWGQWALETGRGRWMVDYNYAGLKGRAPDGGSAPWSTWEETDEGPRRVRSRFRAYESADHGAYDYVKLLSRRYPSAFAAARRGDANTFIDQLDKGGFFTERPEHYTRSVISLAREFLRKHAKLLEVRESQAD
ncbi:MAG TPA: hypothetical protein PKA88_23150 [Polyangiaceae bacterium]|nr:hypothetical protein [Polyangiaceae bacterium]